MFIASTAAFAVLGNPASMACTALCFSPGELASVTRHWPSLFHSYRCERIKQHPQAWTARSVTIMPHFLSGVVAVTKDVVVE